MTDLITKTRLIQQWAGVLDDGAYGLATANAIIAKAGIGSNGAPATALTMRIMLEIMEHEAIVPEAYKDSVGVWTWGVGVTSKSGHAVERYKDQPQSIERCLEVYAWLLRDKYLPDVFKAFGDRKLTEHELGAALSFHWNTGAIGKADWVQSVKAGRINAARSEIMNWSTPREIIGRRKCERDLFFDGRWTSDGLVTVYDVRKSSYTPNWSSSRQVDIREALKAVVAGA